jgi:hypothetical protein
VQENAWNFNDPNGVPGFGDLGPEVDIKRMVTKILGEAPRLTLAPGAARRIEQCGRFHVAGSNKARYYRHLPAAAFVG